MADWLSHQNVELLPWCVAHGGVYAQMLGSLLAPRKREDGVYEFVAPIEKEGSMPFVGLEEYGVGVR